MIQGKSSRPFFWPSVVQLLNSLDIPCQWTESGQQLPNLLRENTPESNVLVDDIRFVRLEPSQIDSEQFWRVSFVYCVVQLANRHDCLVHPPCSHVDQWWLQLIEGSDADHDVWLWADGDEAWIQENPVCPDWLQLQEKQWSSACQALRRRLERIRTSPLVPMNVASRNARIQAATPEQRLAAISWLIYTSKSGEELDYQRGWSPRSKFSLGESIRNWGQMMFSLFGALPSFPDQPEAWEKFMKQRNSVGCTCMGSRLLCDAIPEWLRMATWLQGTNVEVGYLDPCYCLSCKDRASADYDVFYGADHFWEMQPIPTLLVFSLEAMSYLDDCDQSLMLPFAIAMVSKSLFPGSRSSEEARLRNFYDQGDRDVELSPWINSHPDVGRKYLERYACYLGSRVLQTTIVTEFLDDYLEVLPRAFAQGAPHLLVFIGSLAWILGSRFLGHPFTARDWHGYWGRVLSGDFMAGLYVPAPTDTARILRDELKRTNASTQDTCCSDELEWDDDLWTSYAAIMEFVKSKIPDPQFKGCPKCHTIYLSTMANSASSLSSYQHNTSVNLLQEHFGHIPDLTGLIKRLDNFPTAKGGNADIYKCRLRQGNGRYINVAVKVFRAEPHTGPQTAPYRGFRREIKVWHVLRHRNIVPLLGVVSGFGPMVSPVSPWVSSGPLYAYLDRKDEELTLYDRFNLIEGIAEGIKCLHSFPIIHGDLTPANVLVEHDGTARLIDFGLCTVIGGISGGSSMIQRTICPGTIPFAAPELLLNPDTALPSQKSDIYSLGCAMVQILSGQPPWRKVYSPTIVLELHSGAQVPRPEHRPICDEDWAFILQCCSAADLRPSISQFLDYISPRRESLEESQTPLSRSSDSSSRTLCRLKRPYEELDGGGFENEEDEDDQDERDDRPLKRHRLSFDSPQL